MAGQVIMQGFVRLHDPDLAAPARDDGCRPSSSSRSGVDATEALVLSQVVLSFALPVPMIALRALHAPARHHGPLRQRPGVTGGGRCGDRRDLAFNALLVMQTLGAVP